VTVADADLRGVREGDLLAVQQVDPLRQ
jgi:hypothetical protein